MFIDWFDRGDVEIVRDAAAQGDSVRVLTVHGAKGLQAPLVILADATVDPKRMGNMRGFDWELEPGGSKLPVLPPRRAEKRSEEHTSELQSLMRISYAVFCLKKKIP